MKNHNILPLQIREYKLKEQLNGAKFNGDYSLGLYRNRQGKICFAKRWEGKKKNIAYKWLQNEAQVYKYLNLDINSPINIPHLIETVEDDQSLTLFIEYIDGKNIQSVRAGQKALLYENILLNFSGYQSEEFLVSRPPIYWVLITPFITFLAIIKHPSEYLEIVRGYLLVIRNTHLLLTRKQRSPVHRDLNDNNVILQSGKVFLIDFELTILSDPIIDVAILLLKNNSDFNFIKSMRNTKYVKEILNNPKAHKVLKAYITIFSLYDLCHADGLHHASLRHLKNI